MKRAWEIFDHQRFWARKRVRMMFIALRIRLKVRRRILAYGKNYDERELKYVTFATTSVFGGFPQILLENQAKNLMLEVLKKNYQQVKIEARIKVISQRVTFIKRIWLLHKMMKTHKKTASMMYSQKILKSWKGVQMIILAYHMHTMEQARETIRIQAQADDQQLFE